MIENTPRPWQGRVDNMHKAVRTSSSRAPRQSAQRSLTVPQCTKQGCTTMKPDNTQAHRQGPTAAGPQLAIGANHLWATQLQASLIRDLWFPKQSSLAAYALWPGESAPSFNVQEISSLQAEQAGCQAKQTTQNHLAGGRCRGQGCLFLLEAGHYRCLILQSRLA